MARRLGRADVRVASKEQADINSCRAPVSAGVHRDCGEVQVAFSQIYLVDLPRGAGNMFLIKFQKHIL